MNNSNHNNSNTKKDQVSNSGKDSQSSVPSDFQKLQAEYLNNHLTKIYTEEEESFLRGFCKIILRSSDQSGSVAQTNWLVKNYYTEMLEPRKSQEMIELHNRVMVKYQTPRLARFFV